MAIIKPSYNTDRAVLGEILPLKTPYSVLIDTSEKCNFKCNYCFRSGEKNSSWSYAAKNENMSLETFEKICLQLTQFPDKFKNISLSNSGEPLCNPNLAYMTKKIKQLNVSEHIEIHTNGSLLGHHDIAQLAQAGFTRILVSLQGLNAEAYEKTCGVKLNWNEFINNLKLLYKLKNDDLTIRMKIVNTALDKDNFEKDKEKFYSIFGEMADHLFIENVLPLWSNLDKSNLTFENKYGEQIGNVDYCSALFYKIIVAPNGEMYSCCGLPPLSSFGNINSTSLYLAWNGNERKEILKNHLINSRHFAEPCKSCYIAVNGICSKKDNIDSYKNDILNRL